MVVLNKIYTRTGDDGSTALGTGERRKKYDLRIAAYGTLDEVNAAIGIARGVEPRHADRGIDLVERAIGGDAQVVFLAPLAGAECGGAVVAGAGIDLVENDHGLAGLKLISA